LSLPEHKFGNKACNNEGLLRHLLVSVDSRELNQAVLHLITENKAGILVYMQAGSGNFNDNEGFKNIAKHHNSSLKAVQYCLAM